MCGGGIWAHGRCARGAWAGLGHRRNERRTGALSRVSPSGFSAIRGQGFYLPFHTLTYKDSLSPRRRGAWPVPLPPPPSAQDALTKAQGCVAGALTSPPLCTGCPHQGPGVCGQCPLPPPPLHRMPSPRPRGAWPVPSPPAARTRCWLQSLPQQHWQCLERTLTSHSSSAPRWGRVPVRLIE